LSRLAVILDQFNFFIETLSTHRVDLDRIARAMFVTCHAMFLTHCGITVGQTVRKVDTDATSGCVISRKLMAYWWRLA